MDILKKIFGLATTNQDPQPDVVFGRYTDAYKDKAKYEAWDEAIKAFDLENYTDCFEKFFYYLSDEDLGNVSYTTTEGVTYFELYQGSKLLVGTADRNVIRVESKIAKADKLNIGLLRRLLELNFTLKYTRYALDDNEWITMVFDAKSKDTNPYKLYYGLKELALNSDKQDDILESEFKSLKSINKAHLKDLSDEEKKIKFEYLQDSISSAFRSKENVKLNLDNFPGSVSYLYLDVIYRLDYLLKPEGFVMEQFEKLHRAYYAKNGEAPGHKNITLHSGLEEIKNRSYDELSLELYKVTSTFGITQPSGHERLVEFIQKEIQNIQYYEVHGHNEIVQSIYNYIVGYCLFNYSLPTPDKSFLHLYFMVTEYVFFEDLGFTYKLVDDGKLQKSKIISEIKKVAKVHKDEFGEITPDLTSLSFESIMSFSKSYLLMLSRLKLSPSKNING